MHFLVRLNVLEEMHLLVRLHVLKEGYLSYGAISSRRRTSSSGPTSTR